MKKMTLVCCETPKEPFDVRIRGQNCTTGINGLDYVWISTQRPIIVFIDPN